MVCERVLVLLFCRWLCYFYWHNSWALAPIFAKTTMWHCREAKRLSLVELALIALILSHVESLGENSMAYSQQIKLWIISPPLPTPLSHIATPLSRLSSLFSPHSPVTHSPLPHSPIPTPTPVSQLPCVMGVIFDLSVQQNQFYFRVWSTKKSLLRNIIFYCMPSCTQALLLILKSTFFKDYLI